MSFKITFANSAIEFRKLIDFLNYKDFFQDVDFFFKKDSILIQSMDTSHVSLVNMSLDKNIAQEYTCDQDVTLSINLESLLKILKCSKDMSGKCVWIYKKGIDVLNIKFTNGTKCKSQFKLKLLSRDNQLIDIPSIQYTSIQDIALSEFDNILSNMASFGQDLLLKRTKDELIVSNGDENSALFYLGRDQVTLNDWSDKNTIVETIVSLRYLQWITKLCSLCNNVTLCFNDSITLKDSTPILLEVKDINMNIKCLIASKN
jgi:proliferating cell nuclear antigen